MADPVKGTSSPDGTEELNLQQPVNENQEQPESSKSKRVRTSEQGGSEAKFEASSHQPNKRGRKRTLSPAERKARKNAGDRKRRNDQKIELGKLRAMIPVVEDLKNTRAELVRENTKLKSEITAMAQQMETRKNCKENKLMDKDIPLDMDFLNGKDFTFMIDDLSDAKLLDEFDGLFPLPRSKGGLATNKLIIQGTGTSQTKVLEPDMEQIQAELEKLRAINKELESENARLNNELTALAQNMGTLKQNDKIDNKIPSACCNVELAINKHVTPGKGNTEGALKLKRKREDELNEALKGKLPLAVDDTPTCLPTSSTLSSDFTSNAFRQFATALVTMNHLLSTAGGAESREATHDKQASTSASGIKGKTDVLNLVKNIVEACASLVSYFAPEIASDRAQRESRAVNAEEEDGANQAKETVDDDN